MISAFELNLVTCSMMKLKEEEKWQRIRWRGTHIIMSGGPATNLYAPLDTFNVHYRYDFFIYSSHIHCLNFILLEFVWVNDV